MKNRLYSVHKRAKKEVFLSSYDAVVIGAGASGMVAAIRLAQSGKKVAIIERQNRGGKKILASGNGRCNIANSSIKQKNFYIRNRKLLNELLQHYTLADVEEFFKSLGLAFSKVADGRIFPQSMSALSVLELLEAALKQYKISLFYGVESFTITGHFTLRF
ncbi:MAG: hypothetical protein DSY76_08620, partial [Bacteroidetes bacterium]